MHVALTDGLAIQVLMDPGGVDLQLATELWEDFARYVARRAAGLADDLGHRGIAAH